MRFCTLLTSAWVHRSTLWPPYSRKNGLQKSGLLKLKRSQSPLSDLRPPKNTPVHTFSNFGQIFNDLIAFGKDFRWLFNMFHIFLHRFPTELKWQIPTFLFFLSSQKRTIQQAIRPTKLSITHKCTRLFRWLFNMFHIFLHRFPTELKWQNDPTHHKTNPNAMSYTGQTAYAQLAAEHWMCLYKYNKSRRNEFKHKDLQN